VIEVARSLGSSLPRSLPVSGGPRGVPTITVPFKLAPKVHPLLSCASSSELTSCACSKPFGLQAPSMRFVSPSRHRPKESTSRRHPEPTMFHPRSFALPRRFSPPLAWRVYFTPLPRPGFTLQGFPLRHGRATSSMAVSLWTFGSVSYHPLSRAAPKALLRLQGLAPCAESVSSSWWFRPTMGSSPSWV